MDVINKFLILIEQQANAWLPLAISTIVSFLVFIWLYYDYKYAKINKKMNTHGPRPLPIVGNLLTILTGNRDKFFIDWHEKYGKVFTYFVGSKPQIAILDCEVVKQICTKDFDSFVNHSTLIAGQTRITRQFLIFMCDNSWKRIRAMLTPTFTSSKIKTMYKLIDVCSNELVKCIGEQIDALQEPIDYTTKNININSNDNNNTSIDKSDVRLVTKRVDFQVKETYQLFTLDAIASCCYALKINRQPGEYSIDKAAKRNDLVNALMKLFVVDKLRVFLLLVLPKFLHKFIYAPSSLEHMLFIEKSLLPVIEDRRKNKHKLYDDYLQILVNAKLDDKIELTESDELENHHANLTENSLKRDQEKNVDDVNKDEKINEFNNNNNNTKVQLNEEEMISNAVFLLIVGLETTATSLLLITYSLAMHQKEQEKLYQELKKIAKKNKSDNNYTFDYESLTACAYLDSIICESIRIHSPVYAVDRCASRDYTIDKYNVFVPKNATLMFIFQHIHRNPEYWPEPLLFKPERFMPENRHLIVPGSYTPFGQGPRHCLGMRFSLTETKLALAKTVMNYKFTPKSTNVWPLKATGVTGLSTYKNVDVYVERRIVV